MRKPRSLDPTTQGTHPMAPPRRSPPGRFWTFASQSFDPFDCSIPYRYFQTLCDPGRTICRPVHPHRPLVFLGIASGYLSFDHPPFTDTEVGFSRRPQRSIKSTICRSNPRARLPVVVPAVNHTQKLQASDFGGLGLASLREHGPRKLAGLVGGDVLCVGNIRFRSRCFVRCASFRFRR